MTLAGPYRLPEAHTFSKKSVSFEFDGRTFEGLEGDTIASALLANGVRVVSRSFKYHRPRGVFSAGLEEPNALFQLHSGARTIPAVRAPIVPLVPGLTVRSEIGWPGVGWDALRILDFVAPLFAAGFYNKTFTWPSWHFWEPFIRKLAGLGHAPAEADPDRYDTQHEHCDVLIIGGGRSGIEAATRAATTGARVLLVEQKAQLGGDATSLTAHPNAAAMTRTTAVASYDHGLVALLESVEKTTPAAPRERLWLVRARKIFLATGLIEQPLVFSNNDRPGIMLAGSALHYLSEHAIAAGRRVVIATNNDSAYRVARELALAKVEIVGFADSRRSPPAELVQSVRSLHIPLFPGHLPINTSGFGALRSVTLGELSQNDVLRQTSLACDALLVSGGYSPSLHLYAQAGGRLKYAPDVQTFIETAPVDGVEIVGKAANVSRTIGLNPGPRVSPVGRTSRQWVDLRHDVTVADIELAVRENFRSVEHIKRHTTLGMSMDQGKVGQAPAAEVIAKVQSIQAGELAHTTFRPPFVPVTLGALVGRNVGEFYAPVRHTPMYAQQKAAGAFFEDFGEWQRAACFPRAGESREQAMHREAHLVRDGVGIYDSSPLGKIELHGPDALEFADRFYINNLLALQPDKARYGIMLRETGIVFDDGTVVVLDKERVLLTTTSSGAGRVAAWLEEWKQCEWPDLRVAILPVTDQWANVALTGQHARTILERLRPGCDISNTAFPHLSVRRTQLLGSEARIYRVSFSGELTYEINVPSDRGAALWDALLEEGRSFGIAPYGVDALLHLRMEKGFIHIGADTDGATVPDDIGFGKPASNKQRHYIGKRSLTLLENLRPDRLQLVGLRGEAPLPVGSHLRLADSKEATDGWITSAGPLTSDGQPIAMALLRAGRAQIDKPVTVYDAGNPITRARVVAPLFYDPEGRRMNA